MQKQFYQYHLIILLANNTNLIMKELFEFCIESKIANLNVLITENGNIIEMYTFLQFNEKNCKDSNPKLLNTFRNGKFLLKKTIFPPKNKNFWQCPLDVVIWINSPHMKVDFTNVTKPKLSGIEAGILKILAENMNFSFPIENEGLDKATNRQFNMDLLSDRNADFLMGGAFCGSERHKLYSLNSLFYSSLLTVVIKRSNISTYLGILLYPFDGLTWFIIVGLICLHKIAKLLVKQLKRKHFDTTFIENPHRIAWLLGILVIRSAYEGSIFKHLKEKHGKPLPVNIEEALADGYQFITYSTLQNFLSEVEDLKDHTTYLDTNRSNVIKLLIRNEQKYAMIINDNFIEFLNFVNQEDYAVFKEPIIAISNCLYLAKPSSLTAEFEKRIMKLLMHGFIEEFTKDYSLTKLFREFKVRHKMKAISMNQIQGVCRWFCILCGLSCVCLAMEMLSKKFLKMKIVMDFLYRL
ncbi:uncharacterized protein LOC129944492 [Eupeodes corollae]|uniref:uncharacterized protein LOC129944492 n=1 Tax=Eupeodes corollae TaxID=290404 RepID=UPI00249072DC|nr:uncharacterized protein LOC129944492 [Eupeodes corollae]